MEKKRYGEVRETMKNIDRSKECWIETLMEKIEETIEKP